MTDEEIQQLIKDELNQFKKDLPTDEKFVNDMFQNGLKNSDTGSDNPFPSSMSGLMGFLLGLFKLKDPGGYFSFIAAMKSSNSSGNSSGDGSGNGSKNNNNNLI